MVICKQKQSGEELRSNIPLAQMAKQFKPSQRRGAPLWYNTSGSNGTANTKVRAEMSSAMIEHHGLKWNCKHKGRSGDELRCVTPPRAQMEQQKQRSERRRTPLGYTYTHCNTNVTSIQSMHQIRSPNQFKAQTQRSERRRTPLVYAYTHCNTNATQGSYNIQWWYANKNKAERSSALIYHWLKWPSNLNHHSGEELRYDRTPRAQMELQTQRSERRWAPLCYTTSGTNGTAKTKVRAEKNSAGIHIHTL